MSSKIRPLKFGLKYSPPSIILEYQLGEKKRRRVMPVRGLTQDADVHDIVDRLIDAHSQLDPGIVPTEQVVRLVQKLIDNSSKNETTTKSNKPGPINIPQTKQPETKTINKDNNIGSTNGKESKVVVDVKQELKNNMETKLGMDSKTKDIKDNKDNKDKDTKDTKDTKDKDTKDTKDTKDNKDIKPTHDKLKEDIIKAPEKLSAAPSRPPILGSLPGLGKLAALPSLQPLSKPAASVPPVTTAGKENTFRHALDSDESDNDLLGDGDDDLDDLLDDDNLRGSLSDLDFDSDNDLKKENLRDPKRKPANSLVSDDDSYHSDEPAKKGNPLPQKNIVALDSPRSDSEDEHLNQKRKTPGHGSDEEDLDDFYGDDFLDEMDRSDHDDNSVGGGESDEDLNQLNDNELNKRKAQMNVSFEKNRKLPGDPGFKYDIQKQFSASKASEWDENEVDDDF